MWHAFFINPWNVLAALITLFHAVGALCAVHALLTARTAEGQIAWFISLITFPYIALPLYVALGPNKFHGYVHAFRAGKLTREGPLADHILKPMEAFPAEYDTEHQHRVMQVFENLARVPVTGGNRVELLVDGDNMYRALYAAVDSAQDYILSLFFIVSDDEVGREYKMHLIERAKAGVRVVFVYDDFGSWWITASYLDELRNAGVEVHAFSATAHTWKSRPQTNFRNHRKIVVVDGRLGITGGMNIGIEQLGLSQRYGPWRDTNILIEGPAVAGMQLVFQEDYHWASGKLLGVDRPPQRAQQPGRANSIYMASGPADAIEVGVLFFLQCIGAARQRLWISSPYFVPDQSVLELLKLASLRGVEIKILLPERYDWLWLHLAACSYIPELEEETDIEFYLYPAYNHQKAMLVDDWLSWIGSANLDNRSMRLNFEGNLVTASREHAREVEQMLERDFSRARRFRLSDLRRQGPAYWLGSKFARLFSSIL
jgi:cardiolipin synthase